VILLLIPRGATGPDLWLIVALVCGGAIIETYRIRRSGQTLSASAAAAVRLLQDRCCSSSARRSS
jgi:hypothetical protein